MNSIWDSNMRDFLERAASWEPTPGGGSVAAVAAAQGLALVLMALEVNTRRKDAHPDADAILKRGKPLLELVSDCADNDIAAFEKYLEALRMPKTTPAEEQERERALTAAAYTALEAPLRAAERCVQGMAIAREAMNAVHSAIASDVGAGAALLHGALIASLYNVDINLKGIDDIAKHTEILHRRHELQRRGDELAYVLHKETAAKIAKS